MDNIIHNRTLTIAVSTVLNNLNSAVELLEDIGDITNCFKLIIIQGANKNEILKIKDIVYIYRCEFGISNSRNEAIKNANSDFIWFVDDDVILNKSFIINFITSDCFNNYDLCFSRIYCSDLDKSYKKYNKQRKSKLSLLKVSSIEIIVSLNFIKENNIRFNPKYGLGAEYPSGEENLFLIDCYNKSARVYDSHYYGIYHPCMEDKRSPLVLWNKDGYPESKKAIAERFNHFISFLLKTRWGIRAIINGVQLNKVFRLF
ncbi:TPA: glycosyltransferase [Photobacterium damselae]